MASMPGKRLEYLKRKHKEEGDIRLDNGKMLALLSELTIEKPWEGPLITVHALGLLDGLRLRLISWLFKFGAIMADYDVRLIIDDGMGEVETMRWEGRSDEG